VELSLRFLVTGATGKVGNAVARRLAERGDEVVALVRNAANARELLPAGVELATGDVTDPESLGRAMAGAEGVFNCMGLFEQWFPDPEIFERVNATGARNVIAAAREAGVKRAVHTSTFDVFHAETQGTVSEAAVADYPKGTAYERSKQHAEQLVLAEAELGIEVVIVNPASVYGPGPWQGAGLDRAFRDAIRRRLPGVPPGGMTLVHADDVAAGQLAAFERGKPGERYILADGYASMRELLSVAVSEAGRGWVPPTLPVPVARGLATAGEALSRLIRRPPLLGAGQLTFLLWQARADSSKARSELGIEFTTWQQGVRTTVRWMADSGKV
jgi:nucleoside-diphosphate-sugar epimerase